MFDIYVIFKLAGLGICVTIINNVLKKAGADEVILPITVVGVVMALYIVAQHVGQLFQVVETMFTF